jgi:hypothetical protein
MRWCELKPDVQRELMQIADELLKSESGTGKPARCAACYYWRPHQPLERGLKSGGSGECRRRAPRDENGFPITRSNGWCGESSLLTTPDLARRIWDEQREPPGGAE